MIKNRNPYVLTSLAVVLLMAGCAGLQSGYEPQVRHPAADNLGRQPKNCSYCHGVGDENETYQIYDHTADFGLNHSVPAYQGESICAMCHQTSFCTDCHGAGIELKPSIKNQDKTFRPLQHRGDYLTRHRIDGRVDPTSCFRCHGNPKSAETCARCHG